MSIRLHINVDHVATVRNARGTPYPDPVEAAQACIKAGADGVVTHLREDRRHIVDADVFNVRRVVSKTFVLEMGATDEMIEIAQRVRPSVVALVPERREERTTEGGLDVLGGGQTLARRVRTLIDAGLHVSLFIVADLETIRAANGLGVPQIELHTGEYAHATGADAATQLTFLAKGAELGHSVGLEIAAGHGLTQSNVGSLVRIPEIVELNIGHAVVSDAIFMSLSEAVRAMRAAINKGRAAP